MRQKDYLHTGRSEQYNAEGYKDMTAYYALRNIEREERAKRHGRKRRASAAPARGDLPCAGREDEKFFREELANAIIIRAAEDWREAKRLLAEDPENTEAAFAVHETERFFLSDDYAALTTYPGRTLLSRLRKEFGENEV